MVDKPASSTAGFKQVELSVLDGESTTEEPAEVEKKPLVAKSLAEVPAPLEPIPVENVVSAGPSPGPPMSADITDS
jgi:hypothetical protein